MTDRPNGPICFRVSAPERALLEVLADARGTTLSAMARDWIMDVANTYLEQEGGIEAIIEAARRRKREEEAAQERTFEQAKALAGSMSGLAQHAPSRTY